MITIIVDTDTEQAQMLAAIQDGRLDAVVGSSDFQLQRREVNRPPRPFAGGGRTNVTNVMAGLADVLPSSGGGGGSGTNSVTRKHHHGPDDPCPTGCPVS